MAKQKELFRLLLIIFLWILAILILPAFLPMNFPSYRVFGIVICTDYLVHVILFAFLVLTLLLLRINIHSPAIIVFLLIVAAMAEIWQMYIPLRTYNIYDLISNELGVILGYGIISLITLGKRFREKTLKNSD